MFCALVNRRVFATGLLSVSHHNCVWFLTLGLTHFPMHKKIYFLAIQINLSKLNSTLLYRDDNIQQDIIKKICA